MLRLVAAAPRARRCARAVAQCCVDLAVQECRQLIVTFGIILCRPVTLRQRGVYQPGQYRWRH
ncbi:hypothetical protein ACQUJS_24450, partial [Ralstonia pseudosolanacearum]